LKPAHIEKQENATQNVVLIPKTSIDMPLVFGLNGVAKITHGVLKGWSGCPMPFAKGPSSAIGATVPFLV